MADELAVGENPSFAADLESTFAEETPAVEESTEQAVEAATEEATTVEESTVEEIPPVEAVAEEAPVQEEAPPVEAAPDLPEGVRVIDKDGKKEFRLNEQRYRTFEEGHHFRREMEQRLVPLTEDGKPPTVEALREAIDIRDKAFLGHQEMRLDFLGANPRGIVDHFLGQAQDALTNGDVSSDPMVPFAATFFDTIAEKHPAAYRELQGRAADILIKDLYELAKAEGDVNLTRSAQHIEKRLFNRYIDDEGKVVQVTPKQRATPQPRQDQATRTAAPQPAIDRQWQDFRVKADTDSKSAVHKVVETSLAGIKPNYDKAQLSETFGAIQDRLNSLVQNELKGDAEWQRLMMIELKSARMAPSEQKRQEIAARIVRRHESRAQQIVQKHLPAITSEAGRSLKVNIDSKHERLAAAQNKRAPSGGGPAPKTSLIPAKDTGPWNGEQSFRRELDALLG